MQVRNGFTFRIPIVLLWVRLSNVMQWFLFFIFSKLFKLSYSFHKLFVTCSWYRNPVSFIHPLSCILCIAICPHIGKFKICFWFPDIRLLSVFHQRIYSWISTFRASVLNLIPFFCTTVIVTLPPLLVWMSLTIPDLPLWVPLITLQGTPSFRFAGIFFILSVFWF